MINIMDPSLIDWSRAQFALTAMYHWLFVPLTLGLGVIMGIMETIYVVRGDEYWRRLTQFWMKIFGVNFAVGVATGLILEFEFGTNWSNYSWLVGDIFGAPLAIEGILAFFMESTFIAVMYFGWDKVSKRFHLASTWLTTLGATISAWWILVANAWMQYPVGMTFNPDTVRNEMSSLGSFFTVAFSPMAVTKFCHTVMSGWLTGAVVVVGISAWYLVRHREERFARSSMLVGSIFGLVACALVMLTGDTSGVIVGKTQPMKLAAFEGLEDGSEHAPLTLVGDLKVPNMLTILATHQWTGFVPGINDILNGGYKLPDSTLALSAEEKMSHGAIALDALTQYRTAKAEGSTEKVEDLRAKLQENLPYFGYGHIKDKKDLVPPVGLLFWSFRIMVGLGSLFCLVFVLIIVLQYRKKLTRWPLLLNVSTWCIPLVYICSQAGWICAEVGRQPWAIQDLLPVNAAVSALQSSSVRVTFFIFLLIFTLLLVAELGILFRVVKKGPQIEEATPQNT
ncbi:MAG: cytochrome ubiquinol oxidase subunit I [Bacteroidaceae bacterium]|nr:cytochrome ubiquinol oxidase subunit I [Bacteroidaceae bacterium]